MSDDAYEWDEAKRRSNLAKHGVDFADAEVFDWDRALTREDNDVIGERRFFSIGLIYGKPHALIWADRNQKIRVISLRRALPQEVRLFEG